MTLLLLPELCNVGLNWHYFLPLCFSRRWSWMGWLVCSRTGGSPQSDGARRDGTDGKSFKFWPQLAPEKRHFTTGHITCTFNNCDLPPILFVLSAVCIPIFFFRFSVFPFQVHQKVSTWQSAHNFGVLSLKNGPKWTMPNSNLTPESEKFVHCWLKSELMSSMLLKLPA